MITTKFVQIFLIRSIMNPLLSLLGSKCHIQFSHLKYIGYVIFSILSNWYSYFPQFS